VARIIEKSAQRAAADMAGRRPQYRLDLVREGVLEKFNVEMIGASQRHRHAEDRELFRRAMADIGLETRAPGLPTAWKKPGGAVGDRLSDRDPASFTLEAAAGHRLQPRGVRGHRGARNRCFATNEVLLEESVLG